MESREKNPKKTSAKDKKYTEEIHEFLRQIDDASQSLRSDERHLKNFISNKVKKIHARLEKLTKNN